MSFILKTNDEVGLMRKANQLVGATLFELGKHIRPGISTFQLEQLAFQLQPHLFEALSGVCVLTVP